jgi:hypothetical protein
MTTMVRPFSKSLWNILVPRIPAPADEVPKALVVGADGRLAVVADAQRLQVRGDERVEAARVAVRLDEQPPAISPSADDLLLARRSLL